MSTLDIQGTNVQISKPKKTGNSGVSGKHRRGETELELSIKDLTKADLGILRPMGPSIPQAVGILLDASNGDISAAVKIKPKKREPFNLRLADSKTTLDVLAELKGGVTVSCSKGEASIKAPLLLHHISRAAWTALFDLADNTAVESNAGKQLDLPGFTVDNPTPEKVTPIRAETAKPEKQTEPAVDDVKSIADQLRDREVKALLAFRSDATTRADVQERIGEEWATGPNGVKNVNRALMRIEECGLIQGSEVRPGQQRNYVITAPLGVKVSDLLASRLAPDSAAG